MAITAEQKLQRQQYIGSSDAAALCNCDPYRTAYEVWADKTGKLVEGDNGNDAMEAGTLLEGAVLDWLERQDRRLIRNVFRASGVLCANFDAFVMNATEIVEAKTTGIVGPPDPEFGDVTETVDGEMPELPKRVIVQVHHAMHVAGPQYQLAWVPVLIGRVGFRLYRVRRDDRIASGVAERGQEFWDRYVKTDTPPPTDGPPPLEVLRRLRREPNKVAEVSRETFERWILQRGAADQEAEALEQAKAALLAEGGDAEAFAVDGRIVATFYSQESERIDAKLLRQRFPDVARECLKASTCRVLRLKKQKES